MRWNDVKLLSNQNTKQVPIVLTFPLTIDKPEENLPNKTNLHPWATLHSPLERKDLLLYEALYRAQGSHLHQECKLPRDIAATMNAYVGYPNQSPCRGYARPLVIHSYSKSQV